MNQLKTVPMYVRFVGSTALVLAFIATFAACGGNGSSPGDARPGDDAPGDAAADGGTDATADGGADAAPDAAPLACSCAVTAAGTTRSSAIAISPDDHTLLSVNRDVGSVTVARADYADGQPALTKISELDLGAGCEPWSVTIDACGECAYVVTRQTQKVVRIEGINTATPTIGPSVSVGSEPTAVALSPNGTKLFVANWVEGTVTVLDPAAMTVTSTVDLNGTLLATGLLGPVPATSRPALAHPRALAVTNNGDTSDDDETLLVTEFFAQRIAPESASTADVTFAGLVYAVTLATGAATTIQLPAVADTGFVDHDNAATGCFPNQLSAVSVAGGYAWVTSTCASPKGPLGVYQATGACTALDEATVCGFGGTCNTSTSTCNPNYTDVKTTTHPAVSAIDLGTKTAVTYTLDNRFVAIGSTRMPLSPTDIAFKNGAAYVTAMGADAAFRVSTTSGSITSVGGLVPFINLRKGSTDKLIRLPIGVAMASASAFAFVANDGSRDITALSLNDQAIAGDQATDFRILQASELPLAGTAAAKQLRGKRTFGTGLDRWSLGGQAWSSCASCHPDGLSDNVTWYSARGPRQSTSLDGSFASNDVTDQRIFTWTGMFDEVADFESYTRSLAGGVGAIVSTISSPPVNSDRINTAAESPPQQGLQGSSDDVANPVGVSGHPHSVLDAWSDIKAYMQSIRSPRAPVGLVPADVVAGEALFTSTATANCVGCHSGAKWTISRLFYTPGDVPNAATLSSATTSLSNVSWNTALNNFPASLLPVDSANLATNSMMRHGATTAPAKEQLQCVMRPVGTFATSASEINVLELRQDMATAGQGNAADGRGFNPPSVLGTQAGAPFMHAGNARTLEELFDDRFLAHHQSAIASVFAPTPTEIQQLVAFLLSIDENTTVRAVPAKGGTGGDLCFYP